MLLSRLLRGAQRAGMMFGLAWMVTPSYATAQSLSDELRDLAVTHPQIHAKAQSVNAAEQGIGVAKSLYLPQARLSGDTGPEYTDSIDRQMVQGAPYMRTTTGQTAMTVTQRLFDANATDASVRAAEASKSIANDDLTTTRQNVLLDGASAYLAVLRWTHLVQLAKINVHNVQNQLKLEDERVTKGAGMSNDVLAAKQRLQTAKEAQVNYEGQLQIALNHYAQVFGHPPVTEAMSEPPPLFDRLGASVDDALGNASKNNPSIISAEHSIDLSAQRQRTAESGYWPTIDLVGKTDFMHEKLAESANRDDWSVLLTATWDIFNGWKTQSQVAQASHEHGAAMDNHLYAIRKVDELVRTAWAKLETARQRMELLENAATLAEELLTQTRKLHAAGKETIFDVLDSENRVNDARISFAQVYYDMVTATYELLNAQGLLEVEMVAQAESSSDGKAEIPATLTAKPVENP